MGELVDVNGNEIEAREKVDGDQAVPSRILRRGDWTISNPDESYARQYPPEDRDCALFWRDFAKGKNLTMRERNIAKLAWFIAWGLCRAESKEGQEEKTDA